MAKARNRVRVGGRRARPLGPKVKAEIRKRYWKAPGVPRLSMRALSEELKIGVWQVYAAIHEEV